MDNLCTACLCPDRNLQYVEETEFYNIYSQILNEIPVYDLSQICIRVCWECRAALRSFYTFKHQVKSCYTELLQYIHHGPQEIKLIPKFPRLQISHGMTIDYPEIKYEFDTLDVTFDNQHNSFSEPALPPLDQPSHLQKHYHSNLTILNNVIKEENHNDLKTFANDLDLTKKTEKKRKARKKLEKVKTQNKRKTKFKTATKVKKTKHEIPESVKETESCQEYDNSYLSPYEENQDDKGEINIDVIDKSEDVERKECDMYGNNQMDLSVEVPVEKEPYNESKHSIGLHRIYVGNKLTVHRTTVTRIPKHDQKLKDKKTTVSRVPKNDKKLAVNRTSITQVPKDDKKNEKPQCNECGKVFSSRKTLRYHLNVLHKGNNRYPCPRCGKVYQWKSNLGRHLRSHKARDTGELYCETCDKRFASVATYRQHLAVSKQHVSESEFSYACDDCGKKFVNKTRLRDHIDWEHLQKIKFRCQLCNKPFKCHTSLYVHMKNVHRNKGLKDNLCHVCGKSYQNAAKLRYHIVAMHTTETPYQCEQCSVAFGWYSSLYRHVREVHHKVKHSSAKKSKKRLPEPLPPMLQPHMLPPMPQQGIPL